MQKIVVAITGASGSIYANTLLTKLLQMKGSQVQEISVVITDNAKTVWHTELGTNTYDKLDVRYFSTTDFSAPFASGSGRYDAMIIVPCSMGTLGRIAAGISNDLITRAADVMLKERKKLVCIVRETPYNLVHIKNMETITLAGGIICPATPSFYSLPKTFEELSATVTDRALSLAGLEVKGFEWGK